MEPGVRKAAPGRLPERVYWFRRAIVLVVLAVVIALIVWAVSAIGRGVGSATPATRTSTASTVSPAPSAKDPLEATAAPAPDPTAVTPDVSVSNAAPSTTAPAAPTQCSPGSLSLSLTGPGVIKAGTTADFTVTVANSAATACVFAFDTRFTMKIMSGTDEIWWTADCAQWGPSGSQTLEPGAAATWKTTWDRQRSQATCKVVPTTLNAGTYVANAMYTGAATSQLVMLLTA